MTDFSIIIPVYNAEKILEKCITSLLQQKCSVNYELIFVDDGSKDSSLNILNSFAEHNKNIKVFHKENGGASSARNVGIEKATGEYVLFVDCDDWIDENLLESLKNSLLSHNNPDLIQWGIKMNDGNSDYECIYYENAWDLSKLKSVNPVIWHSPCTKLIRKSILIDNTIKFDETLCSCEDLLFSMELYFNIKTCINLINYAPYHYYQNPQSVTHGSSKKLLLSNIEATKKFEILLNENKNKLSESLDSLKEILLQDKINSKTQTLNKDFEVDLQFYRNTFPEITKYLLISKGKSCIIYWLIFLHFDGLAKFLLNKRK